MDLNTTVPFLLAGAWLSPLVSFTLIVFFGPRLGRAGRNAAHVAMAAILSSFFLSVTATGIWFAHNPLIAGGHEAHAVASPAPIVGDWYVLGSFGMLKVTIGYYIDSLTLGMFCMVTLVASCIHMYSIAYMHGELSEVFDTLAPLGDGQPMARRGRYHRFFQYLSLFCFSMLGLVVAGNIAMVFVFWELVGICSYLLIGFWFERKSASNAANKAFIVNRVGDFGMIIGLMAVWSGMGTFAYNEIFEQVRPAAQEHRLQTPDKMVLMAKQKDVAEIVQRHGFDNLAAEDEISAKLPLWREAGFGYGLLVVAGLGIFCGCVGKSAQFPLHVWLPDAMEGPTPVSALIHAATMVAAGVYLVGRFYPVFTPEVLLVIASVGCITLLLAASIALTATDIKRVLAYSTVSQLGFMMLALGMGGWLAGMFHLFTHAFFKSLLFLCSGSVIHACGTNEMPQMGGLRRKMPITAATMLIGCLAIAGAGIPTVIGLSGFHSKDYIVAQALSFWNHNHRFGAVFYYSALVGACMTAFYMFRMWFMTFAGKTRDSSIEHHAHESPRLMTVPLVILSVPATVAGWSYFGLEPLLRQAIPAGIEAGSAPGTIWPSLVMPEEHLAHIPSVATIAEWAAFGVAAVGFLLATAFYGLRKLDPKDAQRTFSPIYWLLVHKWWIDELYGFLFIRPLLHISGWIAAIDKYVLDWLADNLAKLVALAARIDDWIDRIFVDSTVNLMARWTYAVGIRLRVLQTGYLGQYVLWLGVGTVGLFVLISLYWSYAFAGM